MGVKTVLPAVKAAMARSIVQKHGLNEKQTADLLGLSQSAVSRYIGRERGNLLSLDNTPEILELIEKMVIQLIQNPQNKSEMLELFCCTCISIREKGLMCPTCQKGMPQQWAEKCSFCRK